MHVVRVIYASRDRDIDVDTGGWVISDVGVGAGRDGDGGKDANRYSKGEAVEKKAETQTST